VYALSINNPFIWDDEYLVKDNAFIKDTSSVKKIFSKDIGAGSGTFYHSYRPLQIFSYLVDYSVWRLDVRGYHLTNIIFHIMASLCVYWLAGLLFNNRALAFLTAIFFTVSPIHTEAVVYISGRSDPMAALFFMLTLILYIKNCRHEIPVRSVCLILCYMFGLLSRENCLMLPVVILLYHVTFNIEMKMRNVIPILALTTAYVLIRLTLLPELSTHAMSHLSLIQRLPGFFAAITGYLRILFVPLGLHMEYGLKVFRFSDHSVFLGMLSAALLIVFALRKKNTDRLVFFSIAWFFLMILPVSNLYPVNAYMAEHWLYIPSIGFFLILSGCICRMYVNQRLKMLSIFLACGLFLCYSYLTVRQNSYWQAPEMFSKRILRFAPESDILHLNLGNVYKSQEKHKDAVEEYKKALLLNPKNIKAINNIAFIYDTTGKKKEAIEFYEKALDINPDDAVVCLNIGNAYYGIGQPKKAVSFYEKSIQINPYYAKGFFNLGNTYYKMGLMDKAEKMINRAIVLDPDFVDGYNNLGMLYRRTERYREAIAVFKKAVRIDPVYSRGYVNLGITYMDIDDKNAALESLQKAIGIDPNNARAHYFLSAYYYAEGSIDLAKKHAEQARKLGYDVVPALLR